jgi:hypothetical protein
VGTKCWDWIAEGYSIPNMGEIVKVGPHTLDDKDYEAANSMVDKNALDSSPGRIPRGSIYRGGQGVR